MKLRWGKMECQKCGTYFAWASRSIKAGVCIGFQCPHCSAWRQLVTPWEGHWEDRPFGTPAIKVHGKPLHESWVQRKFVELAKAQRERDERERVERDKRAANVRMIAWMARQCEERERLARRRVEANRHLEQVKIERERVAAQWRKQNELLIDARVSALKTLREEIGDVFKEAARMCGAPNMFLQIVGKETGRYI